MPERIQLRRTKGWRKPEGTVIVARPSKWGNPIRIRRERIDRQWWWRVTGSALAGPAGAPAYGLLETARWFAVRHFEWDLRNGRFGDAYPSIEQIKTELAGHDLACWCPIRHHRNGTVRFGECHADVLLSIANWEE